MKIKTGGKAEILLKLLIGIATAAIPLLLWYLWVRVSGCDILQSHPSISDELGYWRIMYSFSECGLDFGACGGFINSPARWGHFGSHGLSPFLAWGWYALLFPWTQASLVQANFIMLTAAMTVFVLLVHDNIADMIFSAAVLCGTSYIFLFLCSSMLEIPCAAAVIVFAALMIRWERTGKKLWLILAVVQAIYLTLLRYCYAVVAFPLVWELCGFRLNRKTAAAAAVYALVTFLAYFVSEMFIADYPEDIMVFVENAGLMGKIRLLLENSAANIKRYFACADHQTSEFYQRMLFAALTAALCVYAGVKKSAKHLSFAIVLAGMMLMNVFFYDIGYQKEFRSMGPVLVFVLIMTVNSGSAGRSAHVLKAFAAAAAALSLIVAVKQISGYSQRQEYNTFFLPERFSPVASSEDVLSEYFGDEPASAAIKVSETFDTVAGIPPQIGIQWAFSGKDLRDAQTEYIISITDDSVIPDGYELIGEPYPGYQIYKRPALE